ncbi:MAG TPA: bifunctional nicotinamidase/pyrazinamidase [Hyphomicrobiaceae bacterium]|nr:bifunctional nicotinamidase/pyrazinamidase [Hyphomicrobiaceae bacterium]
MSYKITESDILVIVDLQNDFCPGGTLPVPRGDEIVSIVNRLGERFRHVVLSQDWHPALHESFASTHPGKQPFETVSFAYGPQVLWPDHCVQGSPGAQFHAGLDVPHAELVLRKGCRREVDSYSVFYENDRATPTGLAGYLRERGFKRVFLVGLALDVCVRYSAEDAQRCGLEAVVIEEACRGIDVGGSMAAAGQAFAKLAIARVGVEAID